MKRTDAPARAPVWDLPTRLFHWLAVLLIAFSWWSSEEAFEPWHFWSGYALLFLLLFRLMWGFAGSSTARFATFVRGPGAVVDYLRTGSHPLAGHSPIGALSVLALLASMTVQVATGLIQIDSDDFIEGPLASLVSYDVAEAAHDLHELNFDVLLVLIGLHVAAILFYRLVLGRRLVGPMISGNADLEESVQPMQPVPAWRAFACAAVALALAAWLASGAPPLGT